MGTTQFIAQNAACLVTSLSPALVFSCHERGLMGWHDLREVCKDVTPQSWLHWGSPRGAEKNVSPEEGGNPAREGGRELRVVLQGLLTSWVLPWQRASCKTRRCKWWYREMQLLDTQSWSVVSRDSEYLSAGYKGRRSQERCR